MDCNDFAAYGKSKTTSFRLFFHRLYRTPLIPLSVAFFISSVFWVSFLPTFFSICNKHGFSRLNLVAWAIRNAIRANRFARIIRIETPIFIARQADSHESLEFPIRANRANRFARIHATKGLKKAWVLNSLGLDRCIHAFFMAQNPCVYGVSKSLDFARRWHV